MTFGERLVYYRTKKELTQKALAEALGVTPTRLNYWEKDKREPDVEMVRNLSDALGVSADILIGRKEDDEIKNAPAPEGAEEKMSDEDMKLSADLRAVLAKHGVLSADGDITDEQADIIFHAICLMRAALKETVKK